MQHSSNQKQLLKSGKCEPQGTEGESGSCEADTVVWLTFIFAILDYVTIFIRDVFGKYISFSVASMICLYNLSSLGESNDWFSTSGKALL